jgi:hypothetical protein
MLVELKTVEVLRPSSKAQLFNLMTREESPKSDENSNRFAPHTDSLA